MSKFKKTVSKVLKIKPDKVNDKTAPMNVKSWDSFRGLLLITEIEKAYRMKFSTEEILSIKDIGSIKCILRKYKMDPDE